MSILAMVLRSRPALVCVVALLLPPLLAACQGSAQPHNPSARAYFESTPAAFGEEQGPQSPGVSAQDLAGGAEEQAAGSAGAAGGVTVTASEFGFEPATLELSEGKRTRLTFVNEGMLEHDWEALGFRAKDIKIVAEPRDLSSQSKEMVTKAAEEGRVHAMAGAGGRMTLEFTPLKAGTFEAPCLVPGHKEAGMVSKVVVKDANGQAPPVQAEAHEHQEDTGAPSSSNQAGLDVDVSKLKRLPAPNMAAPVGRRAPKTVPVTLVAKEVNGLLDEGVGYTYWTFDGTVPGPMVRARVGDTVDMTLKNATSSKVTHSIDFHAATGPGGGGEVTQVAPGKAARIRFKALNPGVYVYYCATPPVPHHIASGMYGLIVIEPEGGLPKVDREFYVMQGDFYVQGERGEKGMRAFDLDQMLTEDPDYVVFNGAVGAVTEERALQAKVGETVRIFFGVGGPNKTSSFHVIGEIYDRVAPEGASEWLTNIQSTLVPTGGSAIVEFKLDYPGDYTLVDHSLGRAMKGGIGILHVEGPENREVFEVVQGGLTGGKDYHDDDGDPSNTHSK